MELDMKMMSSKRYKGQSEHQPVVLIGLTNRDESGTSVWMVISFRTEDGIGMWKIQSRIRLTIQMIRVRNYLIWKIQRRCRRRTKLRGRGFFHHRTRTRGSFQHGNCQKGLRKEHKLLFGVARLNVFSKAGNRTTRELKWRTKRIERTWVWLMMTVWMKSSND